jgi:hypothetical protein
LREKQKGNLQRHFLGLFLFDPGSADEYGKALLKMKLPPTLLVISYSLQ